jgi:hypothetical protein
MRDFKGMKRQRGRNRNTGGKPQQHNANRAYDSNGPEGIKVRGAAQSVFEKYQQLARDATTGGDRVLAENYLQHAEHYFRLLRAIQPNRPVSDIVGRDHYSSGLDIDFEAEHEDPPEGAAQPEQDGSADHDGEERPRFDNNRQNRDDRPKYDGPREDRPRFDNNRQNRDDRPKYDGQRDDRPRNDGPREDRNQNDRPRDRWPRDDRPRNDGSRNDGQRNDSPRGEFQRSDSQRDERPRDERPRDDRPRDERPRDERPRDERPREDRFRAEPGRDEASRDGAPREERDPPRRSRYDRDRADRGDRNAERSESRDPLAVIEPVAAAPLTPEPPAEISPRLRGQDGAVSELPGFLTRGPEPREEPAAEAPAPKPRRRRTPKTFEGAPSEAEDA